VALYSLNFPYPDEIFQYLEQGHRLAFGRGLITWEFRVGARTWLIPGVIGILLRGLDLVGLGAPQAYLPIVRGLLCLLSTSLVFSSYVLGRRLAGERSGRMAALFSAFWYEMIYFAHKPLADGLAVYAFVGALACMRGGPYRMRPLLLGALAAIGVVLRFQMIALAMFLGLVVLLSGEKGAMVRSAISFVIVTLLGGLLDLFTWGVPFSYHVQSYRALVVQGMSEMWGASPFHLYLQWLMVASAGIAGVVLIWGAFRLRHTCLLFGTVVAALLPQMMIPHKEYRYVLVVVALLLVLLAQLLAEQLSRLATTGRARRLTLAFTVLFLGLSAAGLWGVLPGEKFVYRMSPLLRQPAMEAYLFLAREKHVTGVLDLHQPWWASGGYTLFHRDAPLYHLPDLGSGVLPRNDIHHYVSHLLCIKGLCRAEGFARVAVFGEFEILRQEGTLPPAQVNPRYSMNVYEEFVGAPPGLVPADPVSPAGRSP
jgi:GPI mannosyltransferase 3